MLAIAGGGTADTSETAPAEDLLFPLSAEDVAAGKFEEWQQGAATMPSAIAYTSVEYDRRGH